MKINKEWHENNKMPKNPTIEESVHWHVEHAKHCACRTMPERIRKELQHIKRQEKQRL